MWLDVNTNRAAIAGAISLLGRFYYSGELLVYSDKSVITPRGTTVRPQVQTNPINGVSQMEASARFTCP